MYRISKEHHICVGHRLQGLYPGHPCGRLHGHNYRIRIEIEHPELDAAGFVLDYGELRLVWQWLDQHWDHRTLLYREDPLLPVLARHAPDDVVVTDFNPTAENMAAFLHEVTGRLLPLPEGAVISVYVSETPKTDACYSS